MVVTKARRRLGITAMAKNSMPPRPVQAALARISHGPALAVEIHRSRDGARLSIEILSRGGDGGFRAAVGACSFPICILDTAIEALQLARRS